MRLILLLSDRFFQNMFQAGTTTESTLDFNNESFYKGENCRLNPAIVTNVKWSVVVQKH